MGKSGLYLPGLNGLRAIAAVAVVVSHIRLDMPRFGLDRLPHSQLASYGVTIFFALSGFLITYLLLLERETEGVQFRKFYVRRALRIWPLYYLYLIFALVYGLVTDPGLRIDTLGWYVFLAANVPFILDATLPRLAHYWSLGVEEQFYIFWPWVIGRLRRPLTCIILLTLFMAGTRAYLRTEYGVESFSYRFFFVTRFDCMAIGAIGAFFYYSRQRWFIWLATLWPVQLGCWGAIGMLAWNRFYFPLFGHDLIAGVTVAIMIAQIEMKNRLLNLENPLTRFLGRISYGIYVLHPLVIILCAQVIAPWQLSDGLKSCLVYGCVLLVTIVVASLSYSYFEKPFLKLKERFTVVPTRAS